MKNIYLILPLFCSLSTAMAEVTTLVDVGVQFHDDLAYDGDGNLYFSNAGAFVGSALNGTTIYRINAADNSLVEFINDAAGPTGIGFDNDDRLHYYNSATDTMVRVEADGSRTSVFSGESGGNIVFNNIGEGFFTSYNTSTVRKLNLDGTVEIFSNDPLLQGPAGIVMDDSENIYVANFDNGVVMQINNDGSATALDNGTYGGVGYLTYLAGDLYATAFSRHVVYKITLDGNVELIAGTLDSPGNNNNQDALQSRFNEPNGIIGSADGLGLIISEYRATTLRYVTLPEPRIDIAEDDSVLVDEDSQITFNPLSNDRGFSDTLDPSSISIVRSVSIWIVKC